MGVALEGTSALLVFERLARAVKSFEGLTYAKLAEVRPQWPIVGRQDLFYGGTTYENRHGMGATLPNAATRGEMVSIPKVERESMPRPSKDELLAIPVNKLFDRGTTVMMSAHLLRDRIGGPTVSVHSDTAQKLGVNDGDLVSVSFDGTNADARVKLDDTISVGVVLVPRDMGFAMNEPMPINVTAPEKVE
jgi:NADH-quinone oxidoreductase subunit G